MASSEARRAGSFNYLPIRRGNGPSGAAAFIAQFRENWGNPTCFSKKKNSGNISQNPSLFPAFPPYLD